MNVHFNNMTKQLNKLNNDSIKYMNCNKSFADMKNTMLAKINDEFINEREYINNKLIPAQTSLDTCQEEKTQLQLSLNSQQYNLSRLLNAIETKESVIEQQEKTNNMLMWAFVPMLMLISIMILHACGVDFVEMIRGRG